MNTSQVDTVAVRVHDAPRRRSDLVIDGGLVVVGDGRGGLVVVRDGGRGRYKHSVKSRVYEIVPHSNPR